MNDGEHYREHGYVLARCVFDHAELEEMRAAIDRILASVEGSEHDENHTWSAEQERDALVLKGFHNVQYHDGAFTRAVAHPRLVALLTELIGPNVQLHHTNMLVKPPEQGASFALHQDYPYFPHERHSVLARERPSRRRRRGERLPARPPRDPPARAARGAWAEQHGRRRRVPVRALRAAARTRR